MKDFRPSPQDQPRNLPQTDNVPMRADSGDDFPQSLADHQSSGDHTLGDYVDLAIAEFLEAEDVGQPLDIEAWLSRYSTIQAHLEQFLLDQRQTGKQLSAQAPPASEQLGAEQQFEQDATTDFGSIVSGGSTDTPTIRAGKLATESAARPNVVGGIELGKLLGAGGMGRVYEGRDPSGEAVAVKLLSPDWSRSPESIQRFRQEGEIASSINHPRCVFVRTADTEHGCPYIVMELMTGATLKDLVKQRGPLPYLDALRLISDVAEGLDEAHSHGMIHRDVKPANCYLEKNGCVKVGDFGLARSIMFQSDLTSTGGFVGTPLYASPEQIRGGNLDARTDVYSLCATLYYLLAGQAPFESDNPTQTIARIVSEDPRNIRDLVAEIPEPVERLLSKGLARDPAKRFQSMKELRAAMGPLLDTRSLAVAYGKRMGAIAIDLGIYSVFSTTFIFTLFPHLLASGVKSSYIVFGNLPLWFLYLFVQERMHGETHIDRTTRLRHIQQGSGATGDWDAYLAVDGAPLDRWVSSNHTLSWATTRSFMLQFCDEVVAAKQSDSLPVIRSKNQLWVNQRGRLVILDFPLPNDHEFSSPLSPRNVLRFLATTCLTGQPFQPGSSDAKMVDLIQRPLPAHATEALLELGRAVQQGDISETDLLAPIASLLRARDGKAETVGLRHRLIQVCLMFLLLSPLYGATMSLTRIGNQIGVIETADALALAETAERIVADDRLFAQWQESLEQDTDFDTPIPNSQQIIDGAKTVEEKNVKNFEQRYKGAGFVQEMLFKQNDITAALPERLGEYELVTPTSENLKYSLDNGRASQHTYDFSNIEIAGLANPVEAATIGNIKRVWLVMALAMPTIIGLFIWDIVFRGGWCAWFAGIRYVDGRGRKAGFGRFVLRSMLVWAPLAMLAMIITTLDIFFPAWVQFNGYIFSLYMFSPMVLLVLSLLFPQRALHDRLTGTFPVPR